MSQQYVLSSHALTCALLGYSCVLQEWMEEEDARSESTSEAGREAALAAKLSVRKRVCRTCRFLPV